MARVTSDDLMWLLLQILPSQVPERVRNVSVANPVAVFVRYLRKELQCAGFIKYCESCRRVGMHLQNREKLYTFGC